MFHSFLFDDAELQFKTAANMDGGCAVAYWAEAIGLRWASDERVQCGGDHLFCRDVDNEHPRTWGYLADVLIHKRPKSDGKQVSINPG
jgi:hypothetical protein